MGQIIKELLLKDHQYGFNVNFIIFTPGTAQDELGLFGPLLACKLYDERMDSRCSMPLNTLKQFILP